MSEMDNPDKDIADSVNHPDVRTVFTELVTAATPQEDAKMHRNWAVPNAVDIAKFSAVCWWFGKRLNERLGVPIGLIESSWGGTRIEAWSSPEALDVCFPEGVEPHPGPNAASSLYNSMIHPFQQMAIYGSIWYQGEQNKNTSEHYACALLEMVEDWRFSWFAKTFATDPLFPFGVVQLGPNVYNSTSVGFPNIRWAQAGDVGYLPTDDFQGFFMAVAFDLPDYDSPHGSVHPRYKRQVGDRLALAAYPIAYGLDLEKRSQGPFPTAFQRQDSNLTVTYDDGDVTLEARDLNPTTALAFEICCSIDPVTFCDDDGSSSRSSWLQSRILLVTVTQVVTTVPCDARASYVTGVRYAWSESPCLNLEQCALYSTDRSVIALPAPPFTRSAYIP